MANQSSIVFRLHRVFSRKRDQEKNSNRDIDSEAATATMVASFSGVDHFDRVPSRDALAVPAVITKGKIYWGRLSR